MSRSCIAVGALAVLLSRAECASSSEQSVADFLRTHFRMTAADLGDLARRGVVTRSLDTADDREVATVGVIQLRVPAAFYVAQLRDIVAFKRSEAVLQIGAFEHPPRPDDLVTTSIRHWA